MRSLAALALAPALALALLAPIQPAAAAESGTTLGLLDTLTIVAPVASPYDRSLFSHWIDADRDGCDTRREVLIVESTTPVTVGADCYITGGRWLSWFDGATWTSPADLDIDHFVPLKEAWVSGAHAWTSADRTAFANDLGNPGSLEAVTSAVNSSKGASDPASWLPPLASAHCAYATEWVRVKYRWRLSVDAAEHTALTGLLSGNCGSLPVATVERAIGEPAAGQPATDVPPPAGVVGVQRLAGTDRYGTAVRISQEFSSGVGIAYVASGTGYADALSAAPAAALQGGPLLLVPPTSVPAAVVGELQRLKPRLIVVVGSSGAVSSAVYDQLSQLAPAIRRDGGADRYATSRTVIENAFTATTSAFVATGQNFPDALSASAAAGSIGAPVLLVKGTSTTASAPESALLRALGVTTVTVVGGSSVVSTGIESSLRGVSGVRSVVRVSGSDRYATSVAVNQHSFTSAQRAFFAVGTGFADALAGAALAGAVGAPLYVVPRNCVSRAVSDQLSAFGTTGRTLLGGSAVLSDAVGSVTVCPVVAPPAPPKPPANPGDTKNCGDFATYAEAKKWFDMYFRAYGDVARLDHDKDGIPCESLPGAPR